MGTYPESETPRKTPHMFIESIILGAFGAVALSGIVGAVIMTARDGDRRIPTRRA